MNAWLQRGIILMPASRRVESRRVDWATVLDELKSSPPNFLEQALIQRTKQGPVRWDMLVTIGEPGDTEDNPIAWPDTRKTVKVGTLTISSAMPQKEGSCEKINFDPLVMADGIALTNNPILLFRSPAYAVSFAKRISGK